MKKRLLSLVIMICMLVPMFGTSLIVPVSAAATPEVKILSATDITETSAVIRGQIVKNGGIELKQYGFAYDKGNGTEYKFFNGHIENGKTFTFKVTGLKPGKTYSFQVIAVSTNGNEGKSNYKNYTTKKKSSGDTEKPDINDFDCSEGSSFYVGESVKFYADTVDNDKVAEVILYIDGKQVKTSDDGYISYKTSDLSVGKHTIKVKVTDASGNYREEDMTVTVKGKKKLASPKLTAKKTTVEIGEVLNLYWNEVEDADFYTIKVWSTGFSEDYFDTSTEGYLKKISFDKAGVYAVSIYSRTNKHNEFEQSEPYGINITVVKGKCAHKPEKRNIKREVQTTAHDSSHIVVVFYDVVCSVCGEVLQTRSTDGKTEREDHTFSGNKCTKCDYVRKEEVCKHSSTKNVDLLPEYETLDNTYHNRIPCYNVVCTNTKCNATVKKDVRGNKVKESHTFSGNKCTKCDYVKKEEAVVQQRLPAPVVTIKKTTIKAGEKLSLSWNKVPNADFYTIHCWTTGKKYTTAATSYNSITFDKAGLYAIAVYAQSYKPEKYLQSEPPFTANITVEENECKHTSTKNEKLEPKYSSVDETYHNKIEYHNVVCTNTKCKAVVKTDIEGTTTKEKHTLTNNKCTKCNYVKTVEKEEIPEELPEKESFSDVKKDSYYADSVENLSSKGIIEGYDNGEFRPNNTLTRAEAAVILCRLSGNFDVPPSTTKFSDVTQNFKWASGYIAKATQMGIIAGMTDSTYEPQGKLTAAQFITMIVRWLGLENNAINRNGGKWYTGYTTVAEEIGLLKNSSINNYEKNISRANASVIANNALKLNGNVTKEELKKSGNPPVLSGREAMPEQIPYGKAYYVKGNITSDTPITKVTVNVFSRLDNAQALKVEEYAYPNSYSYNLDDIDDRLHFASYPAGHMEIQIWAANAAGVFELYHDEFEIVGGSGAVSSSSNTTGTIAEMLAYAKTLVDNTNNTYAYGATGEPNSRGGQKFDCSGFTQYVFAKFGVEIPRNSAAQASEKTKVANAKVENGTITNIQPGDILFSNNGTYNHVVIYAGNNQYYHAANSTYGLKKGSFDSKYLNNEFISAHRYKFEGSSSISNSLENLEDKAKDTLQGIGDKLDENFMTVAGNPSKKDPDKVYIQNKEPFKEIAYGYKDKECEKATDIGYSGCGVIALANAIHYISGYDFKKEDIENIARYSMSKGYRVNGSGTSKRLSKGLSDDYGQKYKFKSGAQYRVSGNNFEIVRNQINSCLDSNGAIYFSVVRYEKNEKGETIAHGHIMCIVNRRINKGGKSEYLVLDSYPSPNRLGSGVSWGWCELTDDLDIKVGNRTIITRGGSDSSEHGFFTIYPLN